MSRPFQVARWGFLAVAVIAVGIACAATLDEIAPFPCAKDGTCPKDFTCVPGVGCKSGPDIDQSCTTECAIGNCAGGTCLPHCADAGAACAAGRVCTYPAPFEGTLLAHCALDCTSAPCPKGLECRPLYGAVKGCVSAGLDAGLDSLCEKPEDCLKLEAPHLPITCSKGTCASFCSPTAACTSPGRTCNVTADPVRNGCLVDCSDAGTVCPAGLTCSVINGVSVCGNPKSP